jgi:hypothetical protein
LRCGRPLDNFGNRNNIYEIKKKLFCPDCNKHSTLGFNRGAHEPAWIWDWVSYLIARGRRQIDIQLDIQKISGHSKLLPHHISVPTINKIEQAILNVLHEFEPLALRYLSTKSLGGTWCMDDRFNDLPFDQSLFPEKTLDPRKGNPHMYPTVVIHEKSMYPFSVCVSLKRDKMVAKRALSLALDRAGAQPMPIKIDSAKGLKAAVETLLSPDRILCVNKKEDFTFNQTMEGWFGFYGLRNNKHQCQYKRPHTQELSMEVFRYYRAFVLPFRGTGKTPAETLGLALPKNIKNGISFIPLLEFAYRFTNMVKSEVALSNKNAISL